MKDFNEILEVLKENPYNYVYFPSAPKYKFAGYNHQFDNIQRAFNNYISVEEFEELVNKYQDDIELAQGTVKFSEDQIQALKDGVDASTVARRY